MKEMSLWDLRAVDNSKIFLQTRKECPFISNVWKYFKEEYLKLWVNFTCYLKKKKHRQSHLLNLAYSHCFGVSEQRDKEILTWMSLLG